MRTGRRNLHLIEQVKASRKNVRNFGFLFGGIFAAASLYMAYRGNGAWIWAAAGALLFGAGGALAYPLMKTVYTAWMLFAFALGWINTRVLLGAFFYIVITPIGLFLRMRGKDLLDERIDRGSSSYWIKRERKPFDRKRLERMF
jgi:hypothetical protein